MKRIVKDIEFKHLSPPVKGSLIRVFKGMTKLIDKEIELFSQKAIGHLDKQETVEDEEWFVDKFGECVEMLTRLKLDLRKEVERIK